VVYNVVFRDEARKAFERLDRVIRQQVGRVIDRLAENPRARTGHAACRGSSDLASAGGDWRILYEIRDDEIMI
jgi:mRNA-degrading endonuclease RelE of RelBE toxin-antitoxin system